MSLRTKFDLLVTRARAVVTRTGYYLLDNPPKRSQFRRRRRAKPTGCVVVHTAENKLDRTGEDTGAEAVARFIRNRTTPGSYHQLGDQDSIIPMVPFSYEAFQDGTGSNRFAIGISLAMQAKAWPTLDDGTRDQLVYTCAVMAVNAANWLKKTHGVDLPARRISKAQSDRGMAGFIPHGDRDPARRTDPGRHFPWAQFLDTYQQLAQQQGGTPVNVRHVERIEAVISALGYTINRNKRLEEREVAAIQNMGKGIDKLIAKVDRLESEVSQLRVDADLGRKVRELAAAA